MALLAPAWWGFVLAHRREVAAASRKQVASQLTGYANGLTSAMQRRFVILREAERYFQQHEAEPGWAADYSRPLNLKRSELPGIHSIQFVRDHPPANRRGDQAHSGRLRVNVNPVEHAGDEVPRSLPRLAASRSIRVGRISGTVEVTFEVGPVVTECGLDHDIGVVIAVRTADQKLLLGNAAILERGPVIVPIKMPDGTSWQLAGMPTQGWPAGKRWQLEPVAVMGIVVILLVCALSYSLAERYSRVAAEMRESREHYRIVADALPVPICFSDAEGRFRLRNKAHLEWFGGPDGGDCCDAKSILGEAAFERLRGHVEPALNQSEIRFDTTVPNARLGDRDVHCIVIPRRDAGGQLIGLYTLAIDVTERKRAEAELKRSRDFYLQLFDESPAMIWVANSETTVEYVNRAWLMFTGTARAEDAMAVWLRSIHPGDAERCTEGWAAAFRARRPFEVEYRFRRHDGEYRWVLDTCKPVYDHTGAFTGFIGVIHDLTERKRWEEAIARSHVLVDNARDIVLFVDATGAIIEANKAAVPAYGYSRGELLSLRFAELGDACAACLEARFARREEGVLCEVIHRRKDGTTFPVEVSSRSVPIEGERVLLCIIRDTTERKKAETAQRLTQFAVDHASDAAFWIRQDGSFVFVNDESCRQLGYSREELLAKHIWDLTPGVTPETWSEEWAKPSRVILDAWHRTKSGALLPAEVSIHRFEFEGTIYNCCSVRYITERKIAEDALREAYSTLRTMVQAAPAAIVTLDTSGTVTSWNPAAERLLGWAEWEIMGRSCALFTGDQGAFLPIPALDGECSLDRETYAIHKDGRRIDVSASATPLGGASASGHLIMMLDITERKKADAVRRQHEGNLAALLESLPALAYSKDVYGKYTFVNRMVAEALGRDSNAILGCTDADLFPADATQRIQRDDRQVLASGLAHRREHVVPFQGRPVTLDARKVAIRDEHGAVCGLIGVSFDITERKAVEDQLRRSEERFRRAILEAPIPIILRAANGEGGALSVNQAFTKLTGYTGDEVSALREWGEMLQPGQAGGAAAEKEIKTRSGETRIWTVTSASLGRLPDGSKLTIAMGMDVTENKRLESQLATAQKMEAVGRLAGGIAHDFNNILTVVKGYSDLLLEDCAEGDPIQSKLRTIREAARRAAALVKELLAFSRRQWVEPVRMELNETIAGYEGMLRRLVREHIELAVELGDRTGSINADPVRIEQVVLNLVLNAQDAMPDGGRLAIGTGRAEIALSGPCHPEIPPGSYSMLSVSDTGTGISEEVRSHMFEPFYTTKEVGNGTGLGLSTVYGIVEQFNGHMLVDSRPGRGTRFEIYFPRLESVGGTAPTQIQTEIVRTGTETVLVLEDDADVCAMVRDVLSGHGYRVLTARHPEEAVRIAREFDGEIHALATDVVMPGMSGMEAAQRIFEHRPQIAVLYMSGYAGRALIPGSCLLKKPFTPPELMGKLRQVLDK